VQSCAAPFNRRILSMVMFSPRRHQMPPCHRFPPRRHLRHLRRQAEHTAPKAMRRRSPVHLAAVLVCLPARLHQANQILNPLWASIRMTPAPALPPCPSLPAPIPRPLVIGARPSLAIPIVLSPGFRAFFDGRLRPPYHVGACQQRVEQGACGSWVPAGCCGNLARNL